MVLIFHIRNRYRQIGLSIIVDSTSLDGSGLQALGSETENLTGGDAKHEWTINRNLCFRHLAVFLSVIPI